MKEVETVSRYIDADKIKWREEYQECRCYNDRWEEKVTRVYKSDIDKMHPADVTPVVHGKWAFQYSSTDPEPFYSFCSHCREPIKSTRAYHIYKFCPHCGAKMDESTEGTP